MADKLHVDIVTVEGRRYSGDADFVVAPGSEGELGVLPRHIPLLTALAPGSVKVRNDGEELFFFVSGGFLEVRPDQVTVLADTAERAEDIDEARAEEARRRAQSLLEQRLIEGGARLVRRVPISGSKNAVLPILAASLLTDEECRLKNVPRIEDVTTMARLLGGMGVQLRCV